MKTIFRGRDVEVVKQDGGGTEAWVTFGAYSCRIPACVGYIHSRGASAFHLISTNDDWYQNREMDHALARIVDLMPVRARRIGFGASMGGFGALRYSRRLALDVVIAGSPQTVIDARTEGFDDRWRADWDRLAAEGAKRPDALIGLSSRAEIIILLDPFEPADLWHVDRLPAHVRQLRFPFCGHEVLEELRRQGQFYSVFDAVLSGHLVALRRVKAALHRSRRKRYIYWLTLGLLALRRCHLTLAHKALTQATQAEPGRGLEAHYNLSLLNETLGDLTSARAHVRAALQTVTGPHHAHVFCRLADLYERDGLYNEADQAFNEGFAAFPDVALLHLEKANFHRRIPDGSSNVAEYHLEKSVHLKAIRSD